MVPVANGTGGGTAATWRKLQPRFSEITRTCSYDRSRYGFSELGSNLPRDLNHAVADLTRLLEASGEKPPYILAGHSNGGLIIGAFADLHPERVAALVFLDAAVVLPGDKPAADRRFNGHVAKIRRCLARARRSPTARNPSSGEPTSRRRSAITARG